MTYTIDRDPLFWPVFAWIIFDAIAFAYRHSWGGLTIYIVCGIAMLIWRNWVEREDGRIPPRRKRRPA